MPLFEVLDGKNTSDYCQRVEPSAAGGEKMGAFLVEKILGGLQRQKEEVAVEITQLVER